MSLRRQKTATPFAFVRSPLRALTLTKQAACLTRKREGELERGRMESDPPLLFRI